MKKLDKTVGIGWLNHDAWSETYIGARWIVENKLSNNFGRVDPLHCSLSQMVLIASHQLVELTIFSCIQSELERKEQWNAPLSEFVHRMGFNEAFDTWPKKLTNQKLPKEQPFIAARELAKRRNATVHKEAALATPQMARSALYTGVEASRGIRVHFGLTGFPYESVLQKYPVEEAQWFSGAICPEKS